MEERRKAHGQKADSNITFEAKSHQTLVMRAKRHGISTFYCLISIFAQIVLKHTDDYEVKKRINKVHIPRLRKNHKNK